MKRISSRKNQNETDLRLALKKIADMGYGIKEEMRDWGNIGRNAVFTAREALAGKCKECGRGKEYKP